MIIGEREHAYGVDLVPSGISFWIYLRYEDTEPTVMVMRVDVARELAASLIAAADAHDEEYQ